MGEIPTSKRLIELYCHSKLAGVKQALAYDSAVGFPILQFDVLRTKPTGTTIPKLADRLGMKIKDLVNAEHPARNKHSQHLDLSGGNWIK